MKLGIIADTHDNLEAIQRAVEHFRQQGVELVLHAGDFVAPFALRAFSGLSVPLRGVFGNCDGEKISLLQTAKQLGYSLHSAPHHFELEGRKILLMHAPCELEALAASQCYDLIVYGHLHKPVLSQKGKTLVLSPGEGGGWLSRKKTVAFLDLGQMQAEIVEI